ncbi:MAG: ftsW [Microbacterium sp.]|nr:ftsW [Microbacterium sp.]
MTDQKLTRDSAVSTDTAVMRALKKIRVPATQRNRELGLLLFAIVVYGAALVLVQLGVNGTVESGFLTLASIPAVLALIMHVVLRLRARDADPFVLPIATVLTGIGIAMIYRIDLAADRHPASAAAVRPGPGDGAERRCVGLPRFRVVPAG